ncbi:response regulator transcription factor [Planomonospora venezuelensis]|uniref:DNA-binding response OmpR family regulator n=1 Tax=Planomonospora venezuelensis TaxID=1999 RepID=A0A841DCA1_PLAVE|nr:response regulator [Planomonospora venezuelensis]MBB5967751.1 DNA-binding response OmpR family regulator [Planomonospora venezuelensis]
MSSVLIVEDDLDIRDLTVFRLEQAGHEVRTAGDGMEALTALEQQRPDIVILDWMMPGLSGPEVCRRLRAMPGLEGVVVLMLTSKAQEADVEEGFRAGADDYMVKPFSPRELAVRVGALLARARP